MRKTVVCPICMTKNPIKKKQQVEVKCWKCFFSGHIEEFIPINLYDVSRPELFKEYKENALKKLGG